MPEQLYQLAQYNIGRIVAAIDDPLMEGFVSRLDEINALAEESPGFVWRLQTDEGNATALKPYEDERVIVNMSVWESAAHLHDYVYRSTHSVLLGQRRQWFERFERLYLVLWWVEAGHIPTVEEAKERLDHLEQHGPTPYAFTFKHLFPPTASRKALAMEA